MTPIYIQCPMDATGCVGTTTADILQRKRVSDGSAYAYQICVKLSNVNCADCMMCFWPTKASLLIASLSVDATLEAYDTISHITARDTSCMKNMIFDQPCASISASRTNQGGTSYMLDNTPSSLIINRVASPSNGHSSYPSFYALKKIDERSKAQKMENLD